MNFSFHPESHHFLGAVIGIQEVNYQSTAFLFTFPAQKMTRINPKDANSKKCIKDYHFLSFCQLGINDIG